ncbi:MAG: hypothetical protein AAFO04_06050 [Cyanobacteria bacterium J06592_8]
MSQIHSALAYYWDHKAEIDADIENRLEVVKQLQQSSRCVTNTPYPNSNNHLGASLTHPTLTPKII